MATLAQPRRGTTACIIVRRVHYVPLATNSTTPFAPEVVGETSRGLDSEAQEGQDPRLAPRIGAQAGESVSTTMRRGDTVGGRFSQNACTIRCRQGSSSIGSTTLYRGCSKHGLHSPFRPQVWAKDGEEPRLSPKIGVKVGLLTCSTVKCGASSPLSTFLQNHSWSGCQAMKFSLKWMKKSKTFSGDVLISIVSRSVIIPQLLHSSSGWLVISV